MDIFLLQSTRVLSCLIVAFLLRGSRRRVVTPQRKQGYDR